MNVVALSTDDVQSYRWGLLGNAVSVPVAQWIGQALRMPYAHKYISGPSDAPMLSSDIGTLKQLSTPSASALLSKLSAVE